MQKDFDTWNNLKKDIDQRDTKIYCNTREIWWCSLGLNVGSEEDGKNELFERPVLIEKVFSTTMCRVLPLTSKSRDDANHVSIMYLEREGSVILSQLKTISTKRLSRKLCRLDKLQFEKVIEALKQSI